MDVHLDTTCVWRLCGVHVVTARIRVVAAVPCGLSGASASTVDRPTRRLTSGSGQLEDPGTIAVIRQDGLPLHVRCRRGPASFEPEHAKWLFGRDWKPLAGCAGRSYPIVAKSSTRFSMAPEPTP